MSTTSFAGKVALVTGGGSGIGRATALAFAERGAKVVVADIVDDRTTVNTIKENGGDALFILCDISKEDEVKHMIGQTVAHYGRLDFAFNNAGVEGDSAPTHECTVQNWEKIISINLTGTWYCMKHEIACMLQQGKGAIVNNASVAGLVGFTGIPAYVASKHGVVGLTKNAALDYARKGIRVNVVCPGVIKTPMIDRFTGNNSEVEKQFEAMEPLGRMGQPGEVAEAVIWLCSDAASFVTGHTMAVDGGLVAQ